MQNNFLTSIRSLKLIDGCKGTQVYALNPSSSGGSGGDKNHLRPSFSLRSKSVHHHHHHHSSSLVFENLLPYGLPSADQIDPPIDSFLRPVDPVSALAASFRRFSDATDPTTLCDLYLEQHSLLRPLGDLKLLRRSLRSARLHAPDVHHRLVLSAWLRFERREDELDPSPPPLASCSGTSPALECPRAALSSEPLSHSSPCPCRRPFAAAAAAGKPSTADEEESDFWFCIGDEEVACVRCRVANLSKPLSTLLYGGFAEAQRERINFTHNGISARGMKAVDVYSRTARLDDFPPDIVLELLAFSNKFCCEGLQAACDAKLASLVRSTDDALLLVDFALEETAHLLVAACLQTFLRDLPKSLADPDITSVLCTPEGRERLAAAGHSSFVLYYFLSQVAMEEDMKSNTYKQQG